MITEKGKKRIAILGGGPSALFMYKRIVEANRNDLEIHIFESKRTLGSGMPYSPEGANDEHVTNVSDSEIPEIVTSVKKWIQTVSDEELAKFNVRKKDFNEMKVLPRLLFGQYLAAQFDMLVKNGRNAGMETEIHFESKVVDIADDPACGKVKIEVSGKEQQEFDCVIVCTGHNWPMEHEGKISGYFDSPYPPSKLKMKLNHAVALKGASLTAIDAIRTLARSNGNFHRQDNGKVSYEPSADSPDFKLVMHSVHGMLPAVRFHLEEPLLSGDSLLSHEEIEKNMAENGGFLSLDYLFEKDFKDRFRKKDAKFYNFIKDKNLEEFVESMMAQRENAKPFALFKAEYLEAEQSIKKEESIYWKEMLAVLSFAINYPAKYFSAEDMQRHQKVLMPLISIVIAFVPQSSCEELLALYDAGKLDIISVEKDSSAKPEKKGGVTYHYAGEPDPEQSVYYNTFVNCVGQPHLSFDDFPFKSLVANQTVSPAQIRFKSNEAGSTEWNQGNEKVVKAADGAFYLNVPGITINDYFQVVSQDGKANDRVFMMAVPYIGGYNPDYSGLDFCEQASANIAECIFKS
ncbi:FAD/NAD(P)-binding protein [Dyadobacter sediminis]|uniref:FAD-dependent urate hydroxylase HpyO/Asp monooxygenase CreE-like FAD/NAD(P)-binding domain-containing protein n=1 Tax=Dyadobacter sediminis TaxID=1493691 RepID=A0A5R9KBZ3_9BACT|nr:FAD/NAD(P)-binding protein [Dyadobacter sediminis]TLU92336.1 hypothetical protein FEM55_16555 [Dyadobacter sediminis]GGB95306.1 FAD/NAD(P) binding domain-containing protein [Dyadobacter sediminis]